MSIVPWNVQEGRNISCWLCEHFQRYDETESPLLCEGDCRKDAPRLWREAYETVTPQPYDAVSYYTFIPHGNVQWCNGFQRSLEENIPPSPGSLTADCQNRDRNEWLLPNEFLASPSPPWSKKPILDSCWYCAHFQRWYVDPSQEIPSLSCQGTCMIQPPESYYRETGPPYAAGNLENTFVPPLIWYGPYNWCNRWERTTLTVPDPAGSPFCVEQP